MRVHITVVLGVVLAGILLSDRAMSVESLTVPTVELDRTVHFVSPDGQAMALAAGSYTVEPSGEKAIKVVDREGKTSVEIQAETGTHTEKITSRVATVLAQGEDFLHIVLLLPDGTTLDAIGTFSGVTTRGAMMAPLGAPVLSGVMAMQLPQPGGGLAPAPVAPSVPQIPSGIPQPGTQLPQKFQTQPLQPGALPQLPQKGPQLSGGCLGPDGKLLPLDKLVDIHLVAKATGPFSVQLSWSGPAMDYQVSGPGLTTVTVPATGSVGTATLAIPGTQNLPSAQLPPQPSVVNGGVTFQRPQYPVLPDFDYSYVVKAPLPDGRLACGETKVRTLPAPITPLPSAFVGPTDIRLGFVFPPYAQELNVYRPNYTEDGRRPPFEKPILQEPQSNPSNVPVVFGSGKGTSRGTFYDDRKRINPGLPPLPTNYSRPLSYGLIVEAVWRDAAGRSSRSRMPINVEGPLPLYGWADLHTHPMSNLAFGGKIFHGGPDVGSLLPAVDVPKVGFDLDARPVCLTDHRATNMNEALGDDAPTHGDSIQSRCGDSIRKSAIWILEKGSNGQPGHRIGAPTFDAWPKWNDVTHQKMWWEWIRRAYDGGLRVLVALSHNNRLLGDVASVNKNLTCAKAPQTCVTSDKLSSDLQIMEMKRFISNHSDFMQVARTPAELYQIVRGTNGSDGKIAVILGIEIDNIGDFNQLRDSNQRPRLPTQDEVKTEIQRLYNQDVRYIFPIHITDNVFGDTAPYEELFNAANVFETGQFWKFGCAKPEDDIGYHAAINVQIPQPFSNYIPAGAPLPQAPACSPDYGHRNSRTLPYPPRNLIGGLTPLGEFAITEMMKKGMIIDIDHMSHQAAERSLQIAENIPGGGYPLMSGHSGIRDRLGAFINERMRSRAQLDRIGCLGGMFGLGTDHAEPRIWAAAYQDALNVIGLKGPRCLYKEIGAGAVSFGTDANSLVAAPKSLLDGSDPADRQLNVYTSVVGTSTRFPFSGAPKVGTQVWDFRTDGVAHYGMLADFVKAVWSFRLDHNRKMHMSGQDLVDNHLSRNADNFWRMWVKAEMQKNNVR